VTEEQLHDRATRDETLSAEELARLREWYARLDREEMATLDKAFPPTSVAEVHTQIEAALAQLAAVTQRIQALTAENAALRREIVSLQAELSRQPTPQPA
jgi:DNA repair exonuclease SbcCD ATPase subunit